MSKLHPIFEQAMAPFLTPVTTRNDVLHECTCGHTWMAPQKPDMPCPACNPPEDYDPTPYCAGCGSMTRSGCHCGPIAENE